MTVKVPPLKWDYDRSNSLLVTVKRLWQNVQHKNLFHRILFPRERWNSLGWWSSIKWAHRCKICKIFLCDITFLDQAQLGRMAVPKLLTDCNNHSDCPVCHPVFLNSDFWKFKFKNHSDESSNGQYCMKWSINKCTARKVI